MTETASGAGKSSNELAADRTRLADERTHLADERTSLALTRTLVALDRTLMAWIRTAVSLISFGFTIYKFFQALDQAGRETRMMTPRSVALVMIALGVGSLTLAAYEYRRHVRHLEVRYRAYGPFDRSLSAGLATVIAGLGLVGFVFVLLHQ